MKIHHLCTIAVVNLLLLFSLSARAQQTEIFDDPEASYRLGLDLVEKKQYGAARHTFSRLLEDLPAGESVMRLDAEYYIALADYKLDHPQAKKKFVTFIRHYPDHTKTNEAWLILGLIEYDSRRYRDAIESLEKVDPYRLSPEQLPEYLYKLGYSYLQKENHDKAKEVFFPILNTPSEYRDAANYYYAYIAYVEKDYPAALEYFQKLSPDSEFAEEVPFYLLQINYINNDFDAIMRIGPQLIEEEISDRKKLVEASRIVGEAFYTRKIYAEALKYLEMYRDESRKSLSRDEYYQLAYSYYKAGDFQKAIVYFEKVVGGKDDLSQNAYYHLGDCYLQTGEKQFAQNAFYSAYQTGDNMSIREDALFNYAKLAYELSYDPYNMAIDALKEYISNYPGSDRIDEAYSYLTSLFLSTKNYQSAIDAIENIRVKNRELRSAYQKITYLRGVQLFNAGHHDEALENFRKSLGNNYDSQITAKAKFWTGETHFRLGEYPRAIDYYDDFMTTDGAYNLDIYPMTKYNLGYAYFKMKYYDNAVIAFQQYISRPGDNSQAYVTDALLRIGDCYFVTQNYSEAIRNYEKAVIRNSPDSDYAMFQKALSQGAMGNNSEKITTLQSVIQRFAQSSYTDDAYYEIADTYLLMNNDRNALDWFNRLISNFPNSSYKLKALQKTGLVYYNSNDYDAALEVLKKLATDYPGTTESKEALATIRNIYMDKNAVSEYFAFAETLPFANVTVSEQDSITYLSAENLYMNNDCNAAIDAFGEYLSRFEKGAFVLNAHYYKAECEYRTGDMDAAIEDYNFVLSYPKSRFTENALLRAGEINFDRQNYEAALENFRQLELNADYQSNVTTALYGQLRSHYHLDQFDEALDAADVFLQRERLTNEQIVTANYIRAKSALALERNDAAVDALQNTVELSEGDMGAEAKFLLASIRYQQGRYDRAEELIFELANDYPASEYWKARAFIMLADIYGRNGNTFQAKQTLQSIIDNYPGEDLREIAAQKLTTIQREEEQQQQQQGDTIRNDK
ncbi:MAG: tetratricopeptide repeat protein [Bacteroidales bacterium]